MYETTQLENLALCVKIPLGERRLSLPNWQK